MSALQNRWKLTSNPNCLRTVYSRFQLDLEACFVLLAVGPEIHTCSKNVFQRELSLISTKLSLCYNDYLRLETDRDFR